MKQAFITKRFNRASERLINSANEILEEYSASGYRLTLRQLYYQFVARGILANTQKNYKNLGSIVNDARLAGLIDWRHLEDRTRNLQSISWWDNPQQILNASASQFRVNLWENQPCYVEVWVEKEALAGVIERACQTYRLPFFSCRGYVSQSEMYDAANRFKEHTSAGRDVIILHLGDHDPSGIDMSRDIKARLTVFNANVSLRRLALNMDQIEQYNPPPNPAKVTDSRFADYESLYGNESWELDALEPTVLDNLINAEVKEVLDRGEWARMERIEKKHKADLAKVASNWKDVIEQL